MLKCENAKVFKSDLINRFIQSLVQLVYVNPELKLNGSLP